MERGGPRKKLPTSLTGPALFEAQQKVVERRLLPLETASPPLRAVSRVTGKAVAIASVVASVLTAAAATAAAAAFTVGGCREGTVMTVGSAQLLRRQVPWIRKLGQAPGIGGEGGARANQRPPRAPVSPGRTRGAAEPREHSGWQRRPRPRPLTLTLERTLTQPRRRNLAAPSLQEERVEGGEGGLKPPRPPPSPADHSPSCPLLAPHPALQRPPGWVLRGRLLSLLSSPLLAPHPLSLSPLLFPPLLCSACIIFYPRARLALPLQPGEVGGWVGWLVGGRLCKL